MYYHLRFLILPILFASLSSCQSQQQNNKLHKENQPFKNEFPDGIVIPNQLDTLIASNAPASITRNIIQDSNQNIWMATWEGIIKYDGNSFTNVTKGISDHRFFALLEDRKGNFWFASVGGGVYYFDGESFKNFTTIDGLAGNRVTNLNEDGKGHIWVGTEDGISVYDGEKFRNFTIEQGLCNNDINSVIQDRSGKYWIGTRGIACTYDPVTKDFTDITKRRITEVDYKFFGNVRHIITDAQGNMWLAGSSGLWRYSYGKFDLYSEKFTGYVYEDSKGNIWTSSGNVAASEWTLSIYENATNTKDIVAPKEVLTEFGMLFGILEDHKDNIWYGTLNGIHKYDGQSISYFMDNTVDTNKTKQN